MGALGYFHLAPRGALLSVNGTAKQEIAARHKLFPQRQAAAPFQLCGLMDPQSLGLRQMQL